MKNIRLIIYIVVILAIVCSPALAISSSDLIAQYRGQSASTIPTVVRPTIPIPTHTPTPITTGDVNPYAYLSVTSTPTRAMVFIDGSYRGLTPIKIRELSVGTHQLKVSRVGYEDYSTEIVIPKPSCHMTRYCFSSNFCWEGFVCKDQKQIIDVTLKKIESTQKPTIPTIAPTTIPTTTPSLPKPSHPHSGH